MKDIRSFNAEKRISFLPFISFISFVPLVSLVSFVVSFFILATPALAGEPNQVALVIQFDQDRVETLCIPFEGETITGGKVLERSGLNVIVDASGGMGLTLCKVDDQGCAFPAEHCFCQCMGGGPCAYWNYYYRDAGSESWVYSPLGAGLHKAGPGSVEAWVWGDGHTPPAADLTYESICGLAETAVVTPTIPPASPTPVTPGATPAPSATPAAVSQITATVAATPTTTPTAAQAATAVPTTPLPTPAPTRAASLASYWPFALAVLALILIAVLARRRA